MKVLIQVIFLVGVLIFVDVLFLVGFVLLRVLLVEFIVNLNVGFGGIRWKDFFYFCIYGVIDNVVVDRIIVMFEVVYICFVNDFGWCSFGFSYK